MVRLDAAVRNLYELVVRVWRRCACFGREAVVRRVDRARIAVGRADDLVVRRALVRAVVVRRMLVRAVVVRRFGRAEALDRRLGAEAVVRRRVVVRLVEALVVRRRLDADVVRRLGAARLLAAVVVRRLGAARLLAALVVRRLGAARLLDAVAVRRLGAARLLDALVVRRLGELLGVLDADARRVVLRDEDELLRPAVFRPAADARVVRRLPVARRLVVRLVRLAMIRLLEGPGGSEFPMALAPTRDGQEQR